MYTVAPASYTHIHTHTYIHNIPHTNMHIKHTQYTHIHHTHTHTPHTHHTQMHSPTNSGVPTIVRALPFFSMLRSLADPKSTNLIVELPSRARTIFSGCKPHKVRETLNHFLHIATSTHRLIPLNTGMSVWVLKMTAHFAWGVWIPLSQQHTLWVHTLKVTFNTISKTH